MFSDQLYDHKFDIDDILTALCGSAHSGRWLLCSRDGQLIAETADTNTTDVQDGDDNKHWHVIEPLPQSFIAEISNHYEIKMLPDDVQQDLRNILDDATHVQDLHTAFEQGLAGGWIRERVKEAALEWLDARDMIPPSMRHVRDQGYSQSLPNSTVKVNIN